MRKYCISNAIENKPFSGNVSYTRKQNIKRARIAKSHPTKIWCLPRCTAFRGAINSHINTLNVFRIYQTLKSTYAARDAAFRASRSLVRLGLWWTACVMRVLWARLHTAPQDVMAALQQSPRSWHDDPHTQYKHTTQPDALRRQSV